MNKEQARMDMEVVAVKDEQSSGKGFSKGAIGIVKQIDKNGLLIEFKSGQFQTKEGGSTSWWARYDQVEPTSKAKFWGQLEQRFLRYRANERYGFISSKDKDKPKVDGLEMNWDEIISIIADSFDSASKKMAELEKSLEYNVKQFVDHGESDKKTILDFTEKLQKTRKEREKLDNLYSKVQRFSTIHHSLNDETFTNDEKETIFKLVGQFIVSTSRDLVKFVLLYGGE